MMSERRMSRDASKWGEIGKFLSEFNTSAGTFTNTSIESQ